MSSQAKSLQGLRRTGGVVKGAHLVAFLCLTLSGQAAAGAGPEIRQRGCAAELVQEGREKIAAAASLLEKRNYATALTTLEDSALLLDTECPLYAEVVIEIAMVHFRAGHMAQAIASGETVTRLSTVSTLNHRSQGTLYYVLGSAYAAVNRFDQAVDAYQLSIQFLSFDPERGATRAARVYSDLSFLYLQSGRIKEAEEYLQKSIQLEGSGKYPNRGEQVLRRDTLCHLLVQKGRFTDALSNMRQLLEQFGSDEEVAIETRAHLYRDYGQLCFQLRRLDESATSLQRCMELEAQAKGTPEQGVTLATLAEVQIMQKDFGGAELLLRRAEQSVEKFAVDYPVTAANVAVTAGSCWQARARWSEARAAFLRGVASIRKAGTPVELLQQCLLGAANAAHHLGDKQEEKQLRREAKQLLAAVPMKAPPTTVDVLALQSATKSALN